MSSLKEIAADLGVSHALVSRVLNNRMGTTRVSAATRERILLRAKELDYQPSPLALALKNGRKGVVGIFLHGVGEAGSDLSLNFVQAAGKALVDAGINLWLRFFLHDAEFHDACNEKLMRRIDGLIVAGWGHASLVEKLIDLERRGLHVVSACHGFQTPENFTNFWVDGHQQCYLTTKHLLECGCRKIAHFHNQNQEQRYEGYLRALTDFGVPRCDSLVVSGPEKGGLAAEAGKEYMRKLLESGVEFDGIVAQSDAQAAGALIHLANLGIPRDRWPRITGVDNSPVASRYSLTPLTSASAEMEECARLAVAAIASKMEGKSVASKLVQPHLFIRESTVR